jgi:dienelactone hydrolase
MRKIPALLILACFVLMAERIPDQDTRNIVLSSRTHYKMPVPSTPQAWLDRAAFLRKQILASAGLLPMPEKNPLNAQIFGKLVREGYTIEKVLLETYPGFYLGGNLYRPRGRSGPFPGVASPHGHFTYGRLENTPLVSTPARSINLARQGFVVFSYDMVGYNDTDQVPHEFGGDREGLWNISSFGLHLWDSIRVVDFLTSLPDVDPARIACTGASSGGLQCFYLTAVDDRVQVSAPVNKISAIEQGGGCQSAPNLRVGAPDMSNVLVAAMTAPRPMLIVSATGDWTLNTANEEFPAIRNIYRLLSAEQNVEHVQVNALHNYNKESREAVYRFFNVRLLDNKDLILEQNYRVEQLQDLLVLYNRRRPDNALSLEQLINNWMVAAKHGIAELRPHDAASLALAQSAFRERLTFSLLVSKPAAEQVLSEKTESSPTGQSLVLGQRGKGDRVPAVWLAPLKPNLRVVPTLVVHPGGIAWASSCSLVKAILNRGGVVLAIDAFQTGTAKAPRDQSQRAFADFNQTNDAHRVQDILTAIEYLRRRSGSQEVNLVGMEIAGVWSYFARAMADDQVNLAADLAQFRVDTDAEYLDRFFIPGLRKAGDFRAAAVLNAHGRVLIHNTGREFPADWVQNGTEVHQDTLSEADLLAWAERIGAPSHGADARASSAHSGHVRTRSP